MVFGALAAGLGDTAGVWEAVASPTLMSGSFSGCAVAGLSAERVLVAGDEEACG